MFINSLSKMWLRFHGSKLFHYTVGSFNFILCLPIPQMMPQLQENKWEQQPVQLWHSSVVWMTSWELLQSGHLLRSKLFPARHAAKNEHILPVRIKWYPTRTDCHQKKQWMSLCCNPLRVHMRYSALL